MMTRWRVATMAVLLAVLVPTWAAAQSALPWVFHVGATSVTGGAEMPAEYFSTIAVQIEGTFVGTVAFQKKTRDSSGYVLVQCTNVTDGVKATETSEPGYWECPGGAYRFQAPVTDRISGTIIVTGMGTTAVSGGRGGGGGAWTADVMTADSLGHARCIGDGVLKTCFYTDGTLGQVIRPQPDSNVRTYIWNGFTWCWFSIQLNGCMLTVDPNATGNDKYVWTAGRRPIKTLSLPADALYPRGASSLVTDTALVSGGLISPYITTTDNDLDGAYRYLVMPANWDGGTITATITVVNVNGTPANAYAAGISGECYPAGTVIPTTISATGAQTATVSFGASGSCGGSACSQNDPASATTAAITINGSPAGGNLCGFQARTSASGTTETAAGIKIVQLDLHYAIAKGF